VGLFLSSLIYGEELESTGLIGFDVHAERDLYNHSKKTINGNVELSSMAFEDAMSFVSNEYKVAA
jgi:hypothetical protein